jgi:apolipoprotein D and lipocalin family protein
MGRVQTAGGAFFQKDCVCTQLVVGPYAPGGNAQVENKCRKTNVTGPAIVFNGTLADQAPPGHWVETFFAGVPGVNYTVINIGE